MKKSGRVDKTDDSKVEIQNKERKYMPKCEGTREICEKIPPVKKKKRDRNKIPNPLRSVGKNGGCGRKYSWQYALCIKRQ